jgi:hypothetical protein
MLAGLRDYLWIIYSTLAVPLLNGPVLDNHWHAPHKLYGSL